MVASWVYWLIIPLSLSPFIHIAYREIYKRYIQPAKYYKLIVLDQTEEYTFFQKKKDCLIIQDKKGFILFEDNKKNTGELYLVSTEDETLPSKRDDFGTTTFYYWRNNADPIRVKDKGELRPVTVTGVKDKDNNINIDKIEKVNLPLEMKVKEQIETDNDASVLHKVFHTNMLNSSLMGDEKKPSFNMNIILIVVVLLTLALIFKDQILKIFGGA